ncbi:MAG: lipopolysaccharide biosynthesis protein [Fervidobacterium sp.]|uniref:lipopolysaccharide biosynthesis protein n=1 Tax=Fervidobacterium sp. TaxID=1871331 RepID=UPI00404AEA32
MEDILKKYLSFSAGIWARAIISFFTVPIVSWVINPNEFGKATMYSTVYSISQILLPVGTPNSFMRFYYQKSEEEKSTLLWSCMEVPILLWAIVSSLAMLFWKSVSFFLVNSEDYKVVVLLSFHMLVGIFQIFNQNLIRLRDRGKLYSVVLLTESIANLMFLFILLPFFHRTFYLILYPQLFSSVVSLIVGIVFERSYWFPIRVQKETLREVLLYGYPFIFSGVVWLVLNWIDRIFLRIYTDFNTIGLYSAAFKLSSILALFTSGFSTIWYPYAYQQQENGNKSKEIFPKVLNYVSLLTFSLSFLILCFKDVVFLLFAKSYRSAASISPFLLLTPIMMTLSVTVARGIDFAKKTYWFVISNSAAALFNFVGNAMLIPIYGAKGAAISTGLSMIIVFIIESTVSTKLYPVDYELWKIYILTGVYIFTALVNTFTLNVFAGVLASFFGAFITIILYIHEFKKLYSEGKRFISELTRGCK